MTWKEMRDRMRQTASEIKSGASVKEVASRHGVHVSSVYRACVKHGLKMADNRQGTTERWLNVDWTMQNRDIATLLGVSKQRVWAQRRYLEKPQSPNHRKPR